MLLIYIITFSYCTKDLGPIDILISSVEIYDRIFVAGNGELKTSCAVVRVVKAACNE